MAGRTQAILRISSSNLETVEQLAADFQAVDFQAVAVAFLVLAEPEVVKAAAGFRAPADSKAEPEGGKAVALDKPVVERVVDSNMPQIVLY